MAKTSALLRGARCCFRLSGLLFFIAAFVFIIASDAWSADRNDRQGGIYSHRMGIVVQRIDPPSRMIAANQNGRFQRNFQEWQSLTPQEKETLRRRMQQLNRMPPQDRRHLQDLNDRLEQLSPSERRQLQRALDNWNNLSPPEKEAIRRRFGK